MTAPSFVDDLASTLSTKAGIEVKVIRSPYQAQRLNAPEVTRYRYRLSFRRGKIKHVTGDLNINEAKRMLATIIDLVSFGILDLKEVFQLITHVIPGRPAPGSIVTWGACGIAVKLVTYVEGGGGMYVQDHSGRITIESEWAASRLLKLSDDFPIGPIDPETQIKLIEDAPR